MTNNSIPTSPEEWRQHWQAEGFPWRTEPETKRQEELSKCRAVVPDIKKGIYPFKGMELSRADVEWLLAMHENGRGPIDWNDESQRERDGLDLRGADLRKADLHQLPLTRLNGGLTFSQYMGATVEQREAAAVLMDRGNLMGTQLQRASLGGAQLKGARLIDAELERANFTGAQLEEADLSGAQLGEADFTEAQLDGAVFQGAQLKGAHLFDVQLERANFYRAQLERADLREARLEGANFTEAQLEGAKLTRAHLKGAILVHAQLEKADLREAQLEGAYLRDIELRTRQGIGPLLADVYWGQTNLAVVVWSQLTKLADEWVAEQKTFYGEMKEERTRLDQYRAAVRANRQLAVELQNQGLNEDAARFAYRAQILQRKVLWKQGSFWKWLGSAILALLAGYGYRMWRILAAYLFIILLCAVAYFLLGMYYEPHLSFLEAVLTSVTAFHGRVFSEPFLQPGEPQLWVTAFEAVTGLVIESVFIAMLAQKFFGK